MLECSPDPLPPSADAFHRGRWLAPAGDATARDRWSELMSRLRAADVPSRTASTEELAHRVDAILRRRPRLAPADGDVDAVAAALGAAAPSVHASAPALLGELVGWLRGRLLPSPASGR